MAKTRFDQPVTRRPTLPLTSRDEADLARLRSAGPARTALAGLTSLGADGELTEAMLLHAVFEAGLRAVREAEEAAGYAAAVAENPYYPYEDEAEAVALRARRHARRRVQD